MKWWIALPATAVVVAAAGAERHVHVHTERLSHATTLRRSAHTEAPIELPAPSLAARRARGCAIGRAAAPSAQLLRWKGRPSSSSLRAVCSGVMSRMQAMARRSSARMVMTRPLKSWRCTWIMRK